MLGQAAPRENKGSSVVAQTQAVPDSVSPSSRANCTEVQVLVGEAFRVKTLSSSTMWS